MRSHQVLGLAFLVLGLLILFLLRQPLYQLVIVVLQLVGIFAGFLLVVIGIALILGGRRIVGRGYWVRSSTSSRAGDPWDGSASGRPSLQPAASRLQRPS